MYRRQLLKAACCTAPLIATTAVADGPSEPYEPFGYVEIPKTTEAVVGDDSEYAYVCVQDGFVVVDVRDPTDPTIVHENRSVVADHEDGPMTGILDVRVDGDRLIVPGPGNGREGALFGVAIYDVSDPTNPARTTFFETDHAIHNAYLDGDRLYSVDGDGLTIFDVSEPAVVGRWNPVDHDERWGEVHGLLSFPHDVYVHGDDAYLAGWDAGTWLVDVGDPADASFVSKIGGRSPEKLLEVPEEDVVEETLTVPGNHHTTRVDETGTLLALNKEAWKLRSSPRVDPEDSPEVLGEVELWDVANKSDPQLLTTIEAPPSMDPTKEGINTTPHNMDIRGDRLYTSWYDGGVKIHDVSDPAHPELLAWWRAPRRWSFWTAQYATDEFFVASSHTRGVYNDKGALFTFPNEAGEQQDPPPLTHEPTPEPTATPTESPTPTETASPTPTPTEAPPATATATESPTPTPTESPTASDATPTGTETTSPGFGLLAALGGFALGAERLRRRRE